MEFEIVKAKPEATMWEDMLTQIEPGMAARFEKDEDMLRRIRAFIWRRRHAYQDVYTYTDEEHFYIARKAGADNE